MAIKLKLEDTGKIYASTTLKNGKVGSQYNDVTDEAVNAVFNYILHYKMIGDRQETLEFQTPFLKYGKKYKIEITLIPEI